MNAVLSDYYLKSSDRTSVTIREGIEKSDERRAHLFEQQIAKEQKQAAYNKFITESKKYLLDESLFHIFKQCLPESIDESYLNLGRAIIENFTKEEDSSSMLLKFKTKSVFLAELASIIEGVHRDVIHGCADQDDPFMINRSDIKIFNDKIEDMDTSQITKAVMSRVAKAEEEFVKANIKDKENMDDIATKTQEKINNVSHPDEETEAAMKQEFTNLYHQQVKKIMDRPKNILESIIVRLSESVIKDDSLRAKYSKNGKVNMDMIIETGEIMYTFLEMLNTMKIKEMTPQYIQEALASI